MSRSVSIKLSTDLVDDARRYAPVFNRSISGQIEHWARLGQAIETAPGFTLTHIRAVLEGRFSPSDLSDNEQTVFFSILNEYCATPTAAQEAFFAECGGVHSATYHLSPDD